MVNDSPSDLHPYHTTNASFSNLCRDVLRMCNRIDQHFLVASECSLSFSSHPEVEQQQVDTFRRAIQHYTEVVGRSGEDSPVSATVIAAAFANTTPMQQLWIPVIDHLANSPSRGFNNSARWTQWIVDLNNMTTTLPDLLVRMRTSPIPLYTDEQGWEDIRRKVAYLDRTIDYAYTNKWGGFPKRRRHIGRETNLQMTNSSAADSGFSFHEDTPYAASHWARPDNRNLDSKQRLVTVVFIFTVIAAMLGNIAWHYSSPTQEKGKFSDPAFWFLCQTTTMQILGVIIVIVSVHPHFSWGSWILVAVSVGFSLLAAFIYVPFPMQWSATCSFIGNAVCNLVVLQGLFTGVDQKVKLS